MEFDRNYLKNELEVTPEIARIHAHICGDGSFYKLKEKRSPATLLKHKRRKIYRMEHILEYYNEYPKLLNEFKRDFKTAFNRNISTLSNKIRVKGAKWIAEKLELVNKDSYNWYVPDFITRGPSEVISNWIRSFFDDEAYMHHSRKRILVKCMNKSGLIQISELLKKLSIKSKITGPNCDNSYYLVIYKDGLIDYRHNIGFLMERKAVLLDKIIEKVGREEKSGKL